jgi:hypothetical protein
MSAAVDSGEADWRNALNIPQEPATHREVIRTEISQNSSRKKLGEEFFTPLPV